MESSILPTAGKGWRETFSMYQRIEALNRQGYLGKAKIYGRAVRVPAGSLMWIQTTCPFAANLTLPSVLLEPLAAGDHLPAGVLVSSALLAVHQGRVEIPIVNVGTEDIWLHPHTQLGELHVVDPVLAENSVLVEEMEEQGTVAVIHEMAAARSSLVDFSNLFWPNLSTEQTQQGHKLLQEYASVFSKGEGDLHRPGGARNSFSG